METEIRILHNDDFLNILIKPLWNYSTKVTISVGGSLAPKEYVLERKNYQGSLLQEPA